MPSAIYCALVLLEYPASGKSLVDNTPCISRTFRRCVKHKPRQELLRMTSVRRNLERTPMPYRWQQANKTEKYAFGDVCRERQLFQNAVPCATVVAISNRYTDLFINKFVYFCRLLSISEMRSAYYKLLNFNVLLFSSLFQVSQKNGKANHARARNRFLPFH